MDEQNRIPFAPRLLEGSNITLYAPHADDETLGCGGTLLRHKATGAEVRVVVLTDGAAGGDPAVRRAEVQAACAVLGVDALSCWGFEDRSLHQDRAALTDQIHSDLLAHPADIVYVTSPWELHPDHQAAAMAVWEAMARLSQPPRMLAFYEVGTPLQPNLLTDISTTFAAKQAAAECFQSQFHTIPYDEIAMALNVFRSLTLRDHGVTHAEGFYAVPGAATRHRSLSERMHPAFGVVPLSPPMSSPAGVELLPDPGRLMAGPQTWDASVIVRTKNRPRLLHQALASIWAQTTKPREILIANDGDPLPAGILGDAQGVVMRELRPKRRGRSAAWNAAAEVAQAPWLLVLDDDDVWFPDHVAVLARAAAGHPEAKFLYSDVMRSEWRRSGDEAAPWVRTSGPFPFKGGPFSWTRLLTQNFIPTCGWAVRRAHFLEVGGIDESLELYEDWDFLLRACQDLAFVKHTGITTSEYRFLIDRPADLDWTAARIRVQGKHPEVFTPARLTEVIQTLSAENDLLTRVGG